MGVSLLTLAIVLGLYVTLVLGVGLAATRRAGRSPEEYFLAGRTLGPLVLFMALFGTNATAFVLVGIPGRAYHDGIGTFGVNAPIIALIIPLSFWAIGSPARKMAARLNALTPAELFGRRFDSRGLGILLFAVFSLYTLPYMVTAVKGAALTLAAVTQGAVPEWLGGLAVTVVALIYTTLGGMRATAWTNVLQGAVFIVFMVAAFFVVSSSLGGFEAAMQQVAEHNARLLVLPDKGLFTPQAWTSWGIALSLTVIAFPHMLVRLMAGQDEGALKSASRVYPVALLVLWTPAVLLGVWGAAAFPGLAGRQSDKIFALMATQHMPSVLAAVGFVAVLAAVMSTLDAQILTLGSMLTRDVMPALSSMDHNGHHDSDSDNNVARNGDDDSESKPDRRRQVLVGRLFGVAVGGCVYVIAQLWGSSIFNIAKIAFSGYVTLVPALFFGVRWRHFTKQAAIASILVGNGVLALGLTGTLPTLGFLPVFWALLAGTLTAIAVSIYGPPPDTTRVSRAFG